MAQLKRDPAPGVDLRAVLVAKYRHASERYRSATGFPDPYGRKADALKAGAELTVYGWEIPRERRHPFGPNDRLVVAADGSLRREERHDRSPH